MIRGWAVTPFGKSAWIVRGRARSWIRKPKKSLQKRASLREAIIVGASLAVPIQRDGGAAAIEIIAVRRQHLRILAMNEIQKMPGLVGS